MENLRGRAIPLSARRAWTRFEKYLERMRGGGGGCVERWQRAVNEARCYRVPRSWFRQVSTVRRATFDEQSRHNLRRVRCARLSRGPTGLSSPLPLHRQTHRLYFLPSKVIIHLPGNTILRHGPSTFSPLSRLFLERKKETKRKGKDL